MFKLEHQNMCAVIGDLSCSDVALPIAIAALLRTYAVHKSGFLEVGNSTQLAAIPGP